MDNVDNAAISTKTTSSRPQTATDDESITTSSTESETFETWTLVTDKHNNKNDDKKPEIKMQDANDRIEILSQIRTTTAVDDSEGEINKPLLLTEQEDHAMDDLSDGISIISDCESTGRISPHPYLREHLSNLNLKFGAGGEAYDANMTRPQITPPNSPELSPVATNFVVADSELRQRRKKRSSSSSSDKNAVHVVASETVLTTPSHIYPIVRRGLAGIFYVGVALAILAFIGKLRYPEWEPIGASNKPLEELVQKLTDMELQNNLMRAEIDIISKQVNYLTDLREPEAGGKGIPVQPTGTLSARQKWASERKGKTFKAWSGNGNSMEPVHITKGDLKHPYKCPNGEFVEIAGMCVESSSREPLADQIGDAMQDVLHQSEQFKAFEKVAEKLYEFSENPFENTNEAAAKFNNNAMPKQQREQQQNEKLRTQQQRRQANRPVEQKSFERNPNTNSKERVYTGKHVKKHFEQQYRKSNEDHSAEDDDDDDDDSKERLYKQTPSYSSKERFNKHDKRATRPLRDNNDSKSKENHSRENHSREHNSRERNSNEDNSREHNSKEHNSRERNSNEDNSNERRHKSNYGEHSDEDSDGHWHEKLMQHRENARRQHERQRNEKNWYIERGDSREKMRFGDNTRRR